MPPRNNDHDTLILLWRAVEDLEEQVKQNASEIQRNREDVLVIKTERGAGKWLLPILSTAALNVGVHLLMKLIH